MAQAMGGYQLTGPLYFETEEEAKEWMYDDSHDWESPVRAIEEEVEEDED